jgi:hypothetical protein
MYHETLAMDWVEAVASELEGEWASWIESDLRGNIEAYFDWNGQLHSVKTPIRPDSTLESIVQDLTDRFQQEIKELDAYQRELDEQYLSDRSQETSNNYLTYTINRL